MALTVYQRRMLRYAALVRDVLAMLPREAAWDWLRSYRALARRDLAAVEREWRHFKAGLRPGKGA